MSQQGRDAMAADALYYALQRKTPAVPEQPAAMDVAAPSAVPWVSEPTAGEQWGKVRDEWLDTERKRIDDNAEAWGNPAFNAVRGTPHPDKK